MILSPFHKQISNQEYDRLHNDIQQLSFNLSDKDRENQNLKNKIKELEEQIERHKYCIDGIIISLRDNGLTY